MFFLLSYIFLSHLCPSVLFASSVLNHSHTIALQSFCTIPVTPAINNVAKIHPSKICNRKNPNKNRGEFIHPEGLAGAGSGLQ